MALAGGAQVLDQIGLQQARIHARRACLLEHAGRQIDADQTPGPAREQRAAQAGAAAQVEHAAPRLRGAEQVDQRAVRAVAEHLHEMPVEVAGIGVEEPLHIARGRARWCVFAAHRGKVVAVQSGIGAVRDGLLVGVRGLVEPAAFAQHRAGLAPRLRLPGFDPAHGLEGNQRFGMPVQFGQRMGAMQPGIGVVGFEREHRVGGGERVTRAPEREPDRGQIDERGDAPRQEFERGHEALLGRHVPAGLQLGQTVEKQRLRGIEIGGAHARKAVRQPARTLKSRSTSQAATRSR